MGDILVASVVYNVRSRVNWPPAADQHFPALKEAPTYFEASDLLSMPTEQQTASWPDIDLDIPRYSSA